jgi:hypothetical protein
MILKFADLLIKLSAIALQTFTPFLEAGAAAAFRGKMALFAATAASPVRLQPAARIAAAAGSASAYLPCHSLGPTT